MDWFEKFFITALVIVSLLTMASVTGIVYALFHLHDVAYFIGDIIHSLIDGINHK